MIHPYYSYRSLFPTLSTHLHLASCSQSALAEPISKAIEEYHNSLLSCGNNWNEAMKKVEETRKKFAEFIGAEPDEVAVLSSVSAAISAIATSLPYHQEKNKVLLSDIDFPTVGHIWLAQEPFKDNMSFIHSSNGIIHLEQYEKEVTNHTLLTSIPHVNYYNGFKQNLRAIADIIHRKGSLLFVDAYQSTGHIPINVKEMDIDILVTGTRKYMSGIPGVAFLYVKKELAGQLKPRVTGWLGQEKASAFDIHHPVFAAGTRRFERGTPSFISVYAAYEALKLLLEIDICNIELYLKELAQFTLDYGQEKGLHIIGPLSTENKTSLTSFYVENASKVEGLLREKNILVSARKDVIRIAPHFYNTKDEIQYTIKELAGLINGN
ncbi:aminotransferase class V-fold PLP-dependent enzyme [Aneurinibacillus tyrosinisolvens]|uniref:aminotransferase class V-fold PLP-dependent enzyme n=1 Tax=Aneurinibacillus tyrosinisolvens TaxID=1443435 RepID=UPI00063F4D2D|nr:aminotransferase class V-fold PLP-dependent enzyme [Aneurinibacillus tyrosinisolvens]